MSGTTGMPNLHRVVYRSRNMVGRNSVEILHIVDSALRRNPVLGITGVLYFDDACFVQVIEGEAGAVDTLLASLGRDARHQFLWDRRAEFAGPALFPELAMGFYDGTRADRCAAARQLAGAEDPAGLDDILAALCGLPIKRPPVDGTGAPADGGELYLRDGDDGTPVRVRT